VEQTEAELRALHAQGDFEGVVTLALRRYGLEVLGFLMVVRRDAQAASQTLSYLRTDVKQRAARSETRLRCASASSG
jgi:hypothetical protein